MEKSDKTVPIYTIGYGSRSVDEFVQVLQEHDIAYLIDVRSAPYSRYKPEFSREPLDAELERHGIRYVFMGDTLGGRPDDENCYDTNGKVDYAKLKVTERYLSGIKRLQAAFAQQQRVVLMCSEGKPENCHRSKLIGETLEKQDIQVAHIDENDELQSQKNIMNLLTGEEMSRTNHTSRLQMSFHQSRHIDPPKEQWDLLPTPLTLGERKVYELFDEKLSNDWEMYIQPHLNGLRPDLVLLNPNAGIAVYEIKDWSLTSTQHKIKSKKDNPLYKIRLYKDEILELYCPRLNDSLGNAAKQAITAGLVFTQVPQDQVESLLSPYRDSRMNQYPSHYPLVGSDSFVEGHLEVLFPEYSKWGSQNPSRVMSLEAAKDLRGWLKEPAFSQEQREPLEMDDRQREIATTRTRSGYRRVKGPAGSGKSVAIAARAAEIASEGKRVLVCTFNITLMNYLRDLVSRHARTLASQQATQSQVIRQQIEFRHFHGWCKRICEHAGRKEDYDQLWRGVNGKTERRVVLNEHMPRLVMKLYDDPTVRDNLPTYHAVLVDEGQDYRPDWWQVLRKSVVSDEEMLLIADKTQDIYGTAADWTEDAMNGAGFSGPWMDLETCYRLPAKIIPLLQEFGHKFLISDEVDIPEQLELELYQDNGTVNLRWVQVLQGAPINVCVEEARMQMQRLRSDTAIPDITFLAEIDPGREFVERFKQKGVNVLNTFGPDDEFTRRKKLGFFQGDARVKATTLHSFKGWEARHLVVYVSKIETAIDRALLYTALTRLKQHPHGSLLTVVSSCLELYDFGRTWPDFVVVPDELAY